MMFPSAFSFCALCFMAFWSISSGVVVAAMAPSTDSNTTAAQEDIMIRHVSERITDIMTDLVSVTKDPRLLDSDETTPQSSATKWILQDSRSLSLLVPHNRNQIIQRWALAVIYFSTGGDEWYQCSANTSAVDDCGNNDPFDNKHRFLSGSHECSWAGIRCNDELWVTDINYGKRRYHNIGLTRDAFHFVHKHRSYLMLIAFDTTTLTRIEQSCWHHSDGDRVV